MEQDRENQIKANSVHVDDNFNTLLTGVNNKLDLDGTSTPTADIPFGGHKATNLGTPTVSADAATKGYVDTKVLSYATLASPALTGTPTAPTAAATDDSTQIATTAFVKDVLETMYPVGAVYIGTGSTCPMSALFGTWTQIGTKILTSLSGTAPVKTSSTNNTVSNWPELKFGRNTDGSNNSGDGGTLITYSSGSVGINGQNQGSTDMGKSVPLNLVADFSGSTTELTVNLWERTA
jgi:hypothetical protein